MSVSDSLRLLLTADGTATLEDLARGETYHSKFGAVTESVDVYLRNSEVLQRLEAGVPTSVLEIGFGTGLNFVLTAAAANTNECPLDYTAIEYALPPLDLISTLWDKNLAGQTDIKNAARSAIRKTVESATTNPSLAPLKRPIDKFSALTLHLADACEVNPGTGIDAIYLDAFSVRNNPQLWTSSFLGKLHGALHTDGILATYCVNRKFRDALSASGFTWQKHPGPPGKREVLTATKAA